MPQATMEEPILQPDLFKANDLEAPYQKPEWPILSTEKTFSTASTIQSSQKTTELTVIPAHLSQKRKTAEDYVKDRVGKYAQCFQKDRILPIPELVEAVKPKTLSFVISDTRTRKLAGLKKDYIIYMLMNREGFQAIPHITAYREQNMMQAVRSFCKNLLSKDHQNNSNNSSNLTK